MAAMQDATMIDKLKTTYDMQPHPEGGFFKETYRAESRITSSFGERSPSTAIYFLITPGSVSRLHRIRADELVQYTVKAGTWFGSFPNAGSAYSFVGCTVAPGFEFEDFELGSRAALLAEFPDARDLVVKLTEGLP
ncbi:hypothetical protein JL722_7248 [Aureococcus anophagefferens]|nr:hypothetical protein JL722_7248 [Aureococcus anophagefferens]